MFITAMAANPLLTHSQVHWCKPFPSSLYSTLTGMFITAMAANPLAVNLATEALGQTISWGEVHIETCCAH